MANNAYEDARKQRLEDNMKRFEALGIREISKNLSQIVKPETKSPRPHIKPKSRENVEVLELRRSSRAVRNPAPFYAQGLPSKFCKENLPEDALKMVLEDEDGVEYDSVYIGRRMGLSGGWRGFAMDHNVDDGDALVFELSEPARFKIYIFKGSDYSNQANGENLADSEKRKGGSSKAQKRVEDDDESTTAEKLRQEIESAKRSERAAKRTRQKE